jgi:signal transduction histidine kinase
MRMQATALRAQADRPDPDPARICGGAEEFGELAQSALADLRRLIFELRPLDLAERGLVDAVTAPRGQPARPDRARRRGLRSHRPWACELPIAAEEDL